MQIGNNYCMVIHQDAKTKVWGCSNQYDIQINLRRMEQFVFINLCCHSVARTGSCRGNATWRVVLREH